jgi:formate hydrogenlyase subunit 3/multisubunit Na+/H+ antiporter MnhD subunit
MTEKTNKINNEQKKKYINLYNTLKKITTITLIICILMLMSIPLIIYFRSKYTIVNKNETAQESDTIEQAKDIF